jgi:two-component system, response regulator PdtaR
MKLATLDARTQQANALGASLLHPVRPLLARDDTSTTGKDSRNSFRVLIVEDDYLVASDIEAALTAAGLEVVGVAASAEEAIALAASHAPSLAVMDIRLAGERDGIDAALELFRAHGLRCIFATAHADDDARHRAAPAKPLAWLQKPYSVASLLALINQLRSAGN